MKLKMKNPAASGIAAGLEKLLASFLSWTLCVMGKPSDSAYALKTQRYRYRF